MTRSVSLAAMKIGSRKPTLFAQGFALDWELFGPQRGRCPGRCPGPVSKLFSLLGWRAASHWLLWKSPGSGGILL